MASYSRSSAAPHALSGTLPAPHAHIGPLVAIVVLLHLTHRHFNVTCRSSSESARSPYSMVSTRAPVNRSRLCLPALYGPVPPVESRWPSASHPLHRAHDSHLARVNLRVFARLRYTTQYPRWDLAGLLQLTCFTAQVSCRRLLVSVPHPASSSAHRFLLIEPRAARACLEYILLRSLTTSIRLCQDY